MINQSQFFEGLAIAVATGSTVRVAASEAKCSESQAYRICRSIEFRQRVSELRSEITSQAVGRLSSVALQAVDTLAELLGKHNVPKDRLNAAKAILATLIPLSEFAELRARIDKIENEQLKVA